MLVASLLMLCTTEEYPVKTLVKDCLRLHAYCEARDILINMHTAPNRKNIERVLAGLGYKIKTVKTSPSVKSAEQVVIMDKKQNIREQLSLCYYAMGVTQHMVMDIVIGKVLAQLSAKK